MNSAQIFDRIQTPDTRLDGRRVMVHDQPLGLLMPSVLIAKPDHRGVSYVHGPRGVGPCGPDDSEGFWASLVATGAILFGSEAEVTQVDELLASPRWSRTVAHLCAVADDCAAVLRAVQQLAASHVLVVGAGSIGSMVAMSLAGTGVGALTIADSECLEASQLGRQFIYEAADVGGNQAELLARKLAGRGAPLQVDAETVALTPERLALLISRANALVIATDEPWPLAAEATRLARGAGIDAICCGQAHGEAGVSLAPRGPVVAAPSPVQWMRAPQGVMPSFGPATLELAGLAAGMVVLSLCGLSQAAPPAAVRSAS